MIRNDSSLMTHALLVWMQMRMAPSPSLSQSLAAHEAMQTQSATHGYPASLGHSWSPNSIDRDQPLPSLFSEGLETLGRHACGAVGSDQLPNPIARPSASLLHARY